MGLAVRERRRKGNGFCEIWEKSWVQSSQGKPQGLVRLGLCVFVCKCKKLIFALTLKFASISSLKFKNYKFNICRNNFTFSWLLYYIYIYRIMENIKLDKIFIIYSINNSQISDRQIVIKVFYSKMFLYIINILIYFATFKNIRIYNIVKFHNLYIYQYTSIIAY